MINGVEGLSALTLHDSHANLFDVLITWLFTLEEKKKKKDDLTDFTTVLKTFILLSKGKQHSSYLTDLLPQ